MSKKILFFSMMVSQIFFIGESDAQRIAGPETKEIIVKAGEVYQGVEFPEGTILRVVIQNNGVSSVVLSQDFKMSGHLIKKGTPLEIQGKDLFRISPADGQKINDMEFAGEADSIQFRNDGSVENIFLSKPKIIQGVRWAANNWIEFHPNSKVANGTLEGDQAVGGLNLREGTQLSFYPSGKIKGAKLAKESTWQGYIIKGEAEFNPLNTSDVNFWPNGKLQKAILAREVNQQSYYCGEGGISFFESGQLYSCVFSRAKKVIFNPWPEQGGHEQLIEPGDGVFFNEQGVVIGLAGKDGSVSGILVSPPEL